MIIGLTGKRGVGKSTVADHLENMGFARGHAFAPGKAMVLAYLHHIGVGHLEAMDMVHGDLRDTPSEWLPEGHTARYFMERFGKFMGVEMGPDWTVGAELDRYERIGANQNVVFESVVYEADYFRDRGGIIVRVERPDYVGIEGMETDKAQQSIHADFVLFNDGDLIDLGQRVNNMLSKLNSPEPV